MNGLIMPKMFPGPRIQRKQTITVQVGAMPVSAVKFILRRSDREIRDPACFVHSDLAPDIHSAHIGVGVLRPSVIAEFAGMRDGVEYPKQLTRHYIESPKIARRRQISLASGTSQNQNVTEHSTGASRRQASLRPVDTCFQVNSSVVAA